MLLGHFVFLVHIFRNISVLKIIDFLFEFLVNSYYKYVYLCFLEKKYVIKIYCFLVVFEYILKYIKYIFKEKG